MQSKIIKEEFAINWKRTFIAPFRRWWIMLICAFMGGVLGFCAGLIANKPLYVCEAKYLVSFESRDSLSDISSQLSLASRLLYNCEVIANQNKYLYQLEEEVNKGVDEKSPQYLSSDYIKGALSITRSSTSGTFMYVTVTTEDPKISKKIIDVISAEAEVTESGKVYPKGSFAGYMTKEFTFGTSTSVGFSLINIPEEPETPVAKISKKTFAFIGAVAAGAVSYLFMCFLELVTKKIKEVDDINNRYNAPVLGVLYNFESSELNYGGDEYGY